MKVTYYYSACVAIETPEVSILCDPWFTDPAYDGSWYHFPAFPFARALKSLPAYNYIWISHVHPDHYDPAFIKAYVKKHPKTRVFVADSKDNILHGALGHDSIAHQVTNHFKVGKTEIACFPNDAMPDDIDSALAVKRGAESVIDMNDNLYSKKQIARIKKFCPSPRLVLLGYMGAGPYPQTYFDDPKVLRAKAKEKKEKMFARYRQLRDALGPARTVPFAGQYVLGGNLATLNPYRGVPDATEVLAFDRKALVLDTGGSIDVATLRATHARTEPYRGMAARVRALRHKKLDHERLFPEPMDYHFDELLPRAFGQARRHSFCTTDYYFCIRLTDRWFYMNANKNKNESGFTTSVARFSPRSELSVPQGYLFGLVTHVFHWSIAQIGSHYQVRRRPDVFNRAAESFLNYFQV